MVTVTLARRLTSAQRYREAALCYACAGDADALARRVMSEGYEDTRDASDIDTLMDAVELVTVMRASAAMRGQHIEAN